MGKRKFAPAQLANMKKQAGVVDKAHTLKTCAKCGYAAARESVFVQVAGLSICKKCDYVARGEYLPLELFNEIEAARVSTAQSNVASSARVGPQKGVEHLHNILKGHSLFLVCSGPSLNDLDLTLLEQRGIVTMAINNAAANVRPDYWIGIDEPKRFIEQLWKDPAVCKLLPQNLLRKNLAKRDENGVLGESAFRASDCPNVFGFEIKENFDPDTFLSDAGFCSGTPDDVKDKLGVYTSRTTMTAALKMAFYMGAKDVYLLGCDFHMEAGKGYSHDETVTEEYARANNGMYGRLPIRYKALLPHFKASGFNVYNCNPKSNLKVFPFVNYVDAVNRAAHECNEKPIQTEGMYPRSFTKKPKTVAVPKNDGGALVFNDTLSDSHYGCLGVMNSLTQLLKGAGIPFTDSVSVKNSANILACEGIHDKIARAKIIVVNGEGSIHHNNQRAQGLAAIARLAKQWGKPSALINATLYANSDALYEELRGFSSIFVRDSASLEELKSRSILARLAPDLTFFSDLSGEISPIDVPRVGDSVLPAVAEKLAALAKDRGWQQRSIHYSGNLTDHSGYVESHRRAGFVVTGRFHDVCFCINARVPFVAIESNTNKISALLHDVFGETRRLWSLEDLMGLNPSDWIYTEDEKKRLDQYVSSGRTAFSEMQMALRELFLNTNK